MNPLYHLSSPASPFFTVSDIPVSPPQSLLSRVPPLHDSFVFHQSSTALSPSRALIPSSSSYPQPLPVPETNDAYSARAAGTRDISGGGGDRPWLGCGPTSGPNDAGWGSAVRQAMGWDCGNYWECGGVRIFATALKEYGRIN